MDSIVDPRYTELIKRLSALRSGQGSQAAFAQRLGPGWDQTKVSNVENCQRRLDIVELLDWLVALGQDPQQFFRDLGWFPSVVAEPAPSEYTVEKIPALPIPGGVEASKGGVLQHLDLQGKLYKVALDGISAEEYLDVESELDRVFTALAADLPVEIGGKTYKLKNREAIAYALEYAVERLPLLNPSDIYQHIVYRLFLRQTRNAQSWVRSGGEAVELFIERHYKPLLAPRGIEVVALFSAQRKREALEEMGLVGKVGNSKLDVVLYGQHKGKRHLFAAVHSKASLAERVTDDEPASRAMTEKGFASYLWTFDSKSFPPPSGNLVNYGELGTPEKPSDKREYVEVHGSFSACFSYNTRGQGSGKTTQSGKRIYVSSLMPKEDQFPGIVEADWLKFRKKL